MSILKSFNINSFNLLLRIVFGCSSILVSFASVAQNKPLFIEPELAIGKVIGNYPNFPATDLRTGLSLSYGIIHNDSVRSWPAYFNYPATGITMAVHRLGNDAVYGYEAFVMPFVAISPSKKSISPLWIKLGMGASYFTKHHFSEGNEDNLSIGSAWNWAFQVHLYKSWMLSEHLGLRAGLGFLHASNGHTQLPNFGLNSLAAEVAATILLNESDPTYRPVKPGRSFEQKSILVHAKYGFGLQEFGGSTGPRGGPKMPVHCAGIGAGIMMRKQWKVKAGFTYRYYEHINQYFINEENKTNRWQASNLLFSVGSEFLMGHFGIDVEVGINVFKPFFRTFHDLYETGGEFDYTLKRMFPSRFGLNGYLKSHEKPWRSNLGLGASICANFGEADFSEISLTFVHRIR
jgi:hypothetical protein